VGVACEGERRHARLRDACRGRDPYCTGNRDLLYKQKRPVIHAKETCYTSKRDP
jgi:hypothetical protein